MGGLFGLSFSPGSDLPRAARTPRCHDVITAAGAEPFAPWGGLNCHTDTSPGLQNTLFSMVASAQQWRADSDRRVAGGKKSVYKNCKF